MKKREIIEQVKKIILKHCQPERIYLFGSRVTGDSDERSDIDIAYNSADKSNDHLILGEVDRIETLLKIDVLNLESAGERIKNRVLDQGKVIWSANKLLRFEDGIENFRMAIEKYEQVVKSREQFIKDGYGDMYLDIAVKRFEFTFEMAWKSCKRALDYLGFSCRSPRECMKEAFAQNILPEEAIWLEMLERRNLSAHIYDEVSVEEIVKDLENYLQAFMKLLKVLEKEFQKANK